jgi:hypothetical protein
VFDDLVTRAEQGDKSAQRLVAFIGWSATAVIIASGITLLYVAYQIVMTVMDQMN